MFARDPSKEGANTKIQHGWGQVARQEYLCVHVVHELGLDQPPARHPIHPALFFLPSFFPVH